MLVKGFINTGYVRQEQIIVTRKNKSRLDEIKSAWPNINTTEDVTEVVKKAKYIFLCVKPLEYENVLDDIKSYILPDSRVATKGGITEEGVKVLKTGPSVFNEMFDQTMNKRKLVSEKVSHIASK